MAQNNQSLRAAILPPGQTIRNSGVAPVRQHVFPGPRPFHGFSLIPPAGHQILRGSPVPDGTEPTSPWPGPGFQNLPAPPAPYREQTGQTDPATEKKFPGALSSITSHIGFSAISDYFPCRRGYLRECITPHPLPYCTRSTL